MFVFYDTETTGTNVVFDQILQFAGILCDEQLREVDRFEIRCRILPWVVPSPMALLVTGTSPRQLSDASLPTFFEMMASIRGRLEAWSPATFIGYNSIRFDEPLLQRAFWQTLNPPYLTVTKGNARSDLLRLIQGASHLAPNTFKWPSDRDGRISFKLDQLAPINGFDHCNAHDALGDVEATIFLARRLREHASDLWSTIMSRASKSATATILSLGTPVLVSEHFAGRPSAWFGQRVDQKGDRTTAAVVVRLSHDWQATANCGSEALADALKQSPKVVRRLSLNKSPIVFTLEEAAASFGNVLTEEERAQSQFLLENVEFGGQIERTLETLSEPWPEAEVLEQMIFDGFPSREDEARMEGFQRADWHERAQIMRSFDDKRLVRLALRLLYVSAPDQLQAEELGRIESAIADRLHAGERSAHSWRSIADALKELSTIETVQDFNSIRVQEIRNWLKGAELKNTVNIIS